MRHAAQILAIAVLGLAVVTLASYAVGWEPLRRWLDPPMAINTALGLGALSVSVLILARRERKD